MCWETRQIVYKNTILSLTYLITLQQTMPDVTVELLPSYAEDNARLVLQTVVEYSAAPLLALFLLSIITN